MHTLHFRPRLMGAEEGKLRERERDRERGRGGRKGREEREGQTEGGRRRKRKRGSKMTVFTNTYRCPVASLTLPSCHYKRREAFCHSWQTHAI